MHSLRPVADHRRIITNIRYFFTSSYTPRPKYILKGLFFICFHCDGTTRQGNKGLFSRFRQNFPTDILHNCFFCLHLHHSFGEVLQKLFGQEGWVSGWNHQFAKLTYSIRVPGVRIPLLPLKGIILKRLLLKSRSFFMFIRQRIIKLRGG